MKTNKNFALRELYGRVILMPIRVNDASNDPVFLNDMATVIWKYADECESRDQLIHKISQVYSLQPNSAEENAVAMFVQNLLDMKLVSEV